MLICFLARLDENIDALMMCGVLYLYGVATTAAVELLSDSCVEVPHIVECVEEGGHVQNLTEHKQGLWFSQIQP